MAIFIRCDPFYVRGIAIILQHKTKGKFASLFVLLLLAACSHVPAPAGRALLANSLAHEQGLVAESVNAGGFVLQSYLRIDPAVVRGAVLVVYIEGDGYAWVSRTQPSFDPTPVNPVALKMAAAHAGNNVAYLARPCQYLLGLNEGCTVTRWTSHRFSQEMVAVMGVGLDVLKTKTGARYLHLVGFSGGGAMAALLAARRDDVVGLATVAGNLDPVAWARLLHVSPLEGSLNPADDALRLASIPQMHLVGGSDRVVPLGVAESYRSAFADVSNISIKVIDGFDHHCCWAEEWPQLQTQVFGQ